ncbi:hypothetical protein [Nocardia sp. R7R-8]|uniref:hypothetical protein n=1 Tax=Nocardia sp. R7R-8 TaxID=3459304 RepID=UPI00403DE1BF
MTTIVRIDDTARDYETWKSGFDGLERFFTEAGARNCRVARFTHNANRVLVELDFDTMAEAEAFRDELHKLYDLPQVQMTMVSHEVSLLELVEDRRLTLRTSS